MKYDLITDRKGTWAVVFWRNAVPRYSLRLETEETEEIAEVLAKHNLARDDSIPDAIDTDHVRVRVKEAI